MTPLQQASKMCETLTEGIKARDELIKELKSEFSYFVHQYGCVCGHPACRGCKDVKEANELISRDDI